MIRISGISFASVTSELGTGVSIPSLCLAYSPETLLVRLLAFPLFWDLEPVFCISRDRSSYTLSMENISPLQPNRRLVNPSFQGFFFPTTNRLHLARDKNCERVFEPRSHFIRRLSMSWLMSGLSWFKSHNGFRHGGQYVVCTMPVTVEYDSAATIQYDSVSKPTF